MKMFNKLLSITKQNSYRSIFLVGTIMLVGVLLLIISNASTSNLVVEPESGQLSCSKLGSSDSLASSGSSIRFTDQCSGSADSSGASLPISYDIESVGSNVKFVATNGSDANNGSKNSPYATLGKAISSASNGASIIVRGGTYRQGNFDTSYSKSVNILAYPGEIPTFNGADSVSSGWSSEGNLRYHSYSPMPVTSGSGIDFPGGQNLTGDKVGKHPDQVWIGDSELKQVTTKSSVDDNSFWVDQSNNRLYLTTVNSTKPNIEVSRFREFLDIKGSNSSIEGIRIVRYSDTASDYSVLLVHPNGDNFTMKNVEIIDTSFISVQYAGNKSGDLNENSRMQNVTIESSNWMSVGASYTDNLVLDSVKITNSNEFSEFATSPQSGALKTSRTRYTKVLNSVIKDNKSHGLWFDQSNVDVDVANNVITGNTGSSLFFEISDDLLLINNYIHAPSGSAQAVKLAGSSGLKLVNNTIIGGKDPVGIYVDNRSRPDCPNPDKPLCSNSYGSDRDEVRDLPATLDWMPRLDIMINNIIAHPQATQYCGGVTVVCITSSNSAASQPIQNVIHKAEPGRGIPQTIINGNVYSNGTGNIYRTSIGNYSSIAQFSSAMSVTPVNISGIETKGKYGDHWVQHDGTPASTLASKHNEAFAIPNDPEINNYINVGVRHYGVLSK